MFPARKLRMRAIISSLVSVGEVSLLICWLCRMLRCSSPFWMTFRDFVFAVLRWPSFRFQMAIFPSFTAQWLIVHRPVTDRSPPSDSSFNAQWLSVHRPVNDGKVFKEKRNDLCFSLIMKKFVALRSQFTHTSPFTRGNFLSTQRKKLCALKKNYSFAPKRLSKGAFSPSNRKGRKEFWKKEAHKLLLSLNSYCRK